MPFNNQYENDTNIFNKSVLEKWKSPNTLICGFDKFNFQLILIACRYLKSVEFCSFIDQ
jgi:hypothetical protein